jgi:hypothetical protein
VSKARRWLAHWLLRRECLDALRWMRSPECSYWTMANYGAWEALTRLGWTGEQMTRILSRHDARVRQRTLRRLARSIKRHAKGAVQ